MRTGCASPVSSPDAHPLPGVQHVVINSMAQKELARRCSLASAIIPNILDFETPAHGLDDYNRDVRREIGLADTDWFILQPTRVVARKGIEHAIDLVRRGDSLWSINAGIFEFGFTSTNPLPNWSPSWILISQASRWSSPTRKH